MHNISWNWSLKVVINWLRIHFAKSTFMDTLWIRPNKILLKYTLNTHTWGLGLVQDRVCRLTPPPHFTLAINTSPELSLSLTQSVSNLVHGDHPPKTVMESCEEAITRLAKAIKMTSCWMVTMTAISKWFCYWLPQLLLRKLPQWFISTSLLWTLTLWQPS